MMILKLKSKSITYTKDNKYYGTNYWFHNDILLTKRGLYIHLYKKDWIEIPKSMYKIIDKECIELPDNYKELLKTVNTAHIAEYLLLDIACIAGNFLNEEEIVSEDVIEFYELYI